MKYIVSLLLLTFLISSAMIQQKPKQAKAKYFKKQIVENQALVDSGKIIYETYCLACHQEDGSGVPNMNPPLSKTDWVLGISLE